MKFFAPRDWHILHFLLTVIIAIVLAVHCILFWMVYDNYIKNFDVHANYEQHQFEKIEDLKQRIEKLEKE